MREPTNFENVSDSTNGINQAGSRRTLSAGLLAKVLGAFSSRAPSDVSTASKENFGSINETEARRLGLERVEVQGNPAAQKVLARIYGQPIFNKLDILTRDAGNSIAAIQQFGAAWKKAAPNIPLQYGTQNGRFTVHDGYHRRLAEGNVISNLDKDNKKVSLPRFDEPAVLWIENWKEVSIDDEAFDQTTSPLLTALDVKQKDGQSATGVVNISRIAIDEALWTGDPSDRTKTPKHTALITKLGLDPAHYNFRLIRQDEYARLAGAGKNFGNKALGLCTWFDDYAVEGDEVEGLCGICYFDTDDYIVRSKSRDYAAEFLAVRLVLEHNTSPT